MHVLCAHANINFFETNSAVHFDPVMPKYARQQEPIRIVVIFSHKVEGGEKKGILPDWSQTEALQCEPTLRAVTSLSFLDG